MPWPRIVVIAPVMKDVEVGGAVEGEGCPGGVSAMMRICTECLVSGHVGEIHMKAEGV